MTCNASNTHLEMTWNLGGLYQGDNDPNLWKDLQDARTRSLRFAAAQRGWVQEESLTAPRLGAAIQEYEAVHELVMKPYLYAYLWHSQDMRDPRREALLGRVRERRDEITFTLLFFCLELSAISEESLSRLASQKALHKYAHVLDNLLRWKPYLLGEKEEGSIWETPYWERRRIQGSYDRLIGSLSVPVNVEGDAHSLSISQALACLRSPKRKLRANASVAFLRELGSREKEFGDVLRSLLRNYQQEREKRGLPPANILLLRGPGQHREIRTLQEQYGINSAVIAGGSLYIGTAKYVGMTHMTVEGQTGTIDTNFDNIAAKTIETVNSDYNYVFVHIKATDNASHDGNSRQKVLAIEKTDEMLGKIVEAVGERIVIAVTGDHSTPLSIGEHTSDPVPIVLWSDFIRPDKVEAFSEIDAADGALHTIQGTDVMSLLLGYAGYIGKLGA